jgi:3-oxoacyl-[acyl-carrier protein] reductase
MADAFVKKLIGLAGVKATPLRRRYPVHKILKEAAAKAIPRSVQFIGINGSTPATDLVPESVDGANIEHVAGSDGEKKVDAIVCDTRGLNSVDELSLLHTHLSKASGRINKNGRLVMISGHNKADEVKSSTIAAGVGGFVKSFAKEYGAKGVTANMIRVEHGASAGSQKGCVEFLLSDRSSFITSQFFNVTNVSNTQSATDLLSVSNKRIVVTGASRGIGESTVKLLHADGANVLLVDHPSMSDRLQTLAKQLNCGHLALDVTDKDAGAKLVEAAGKNYGDCRLDAVIHNAGITRDKSFKNMSDADFQSVIQVNLASFNRIDNVLLSNSSPVLSAGSRLVYLSSINGIAGAFGQTNYSTTKAGIMGYVRAMAQTHGSKGIGFNAVAPGFIETEMTKKIPFLTRNVARHLNSLVQEGYPLDVAELIVFLSSQASAGLNGETIRVCGGNLVGH